MTSFLPHAASLRGPEAARRIIVIRCLGVSGRGRATDHHAGCGEGRTIFGPVDFSRVQGSGGRQLGTRAPLPINLFGHRARGSFPRVKCFQQPSRGLSKCFRRPLAVVVCDGPAGSHRKSRLTSNPRVPAPGRRTSKGTRYGGWMVEHGQRRSLPV